MPVNIQYSALGAIESIGYSSATVSQGNLITLNRALLNFTQVTLSSTEQASLQIMITAVSQAIKRYCHRDFIPMTYDEQYNGNGARRLLLRQIPITSVARVSFGPYAVMRIQNTNTQNVRASAAVTTTGLVLTWVQNGVAGTDTGCTWANYPTLSSLAGYVNALGNGWSATVLSGYINWPTADFNYPQGALSCTGGSYAEFKLHVVDVTDFQVDPNRGWLIRGINALVTQWDDPLNIWTPGINNYRVIYQSGYPVIPADVQEACAQWTAALFWETKVNPAASPITPPAGVIFILDQYKQNVLMPI